MYICEHWVPEIYTCTRDQDNLMLYIFNFITLKLHISTGVWPHGSRYFGLRYEDSATTQMGSALPFTF